MKTIDQIAAELQGYDPQALRAADVNTFLERLVAPVTRTEEVGIFDALGRVLARDVVSPVSVPPHDNSAMDGYAFDGAQLQPGQPLVLRPVGSTAFAGAAWTATVAAGECVKIMTGAIMPAGLDTVVPQEFTTAEPDGHIRIAPDVLRRGDNRRLLGEDLMQGRVALSKGELLAPAAIGLVASLGLKTVTVYRRVRVAYFSTGDEILSLGEPPREGAVYDSNRYTVFGLLTRLGVQVIDLGVVRDDPTLLEAAFRHAAAEADAIITSGGVSVGEADHTRTMMKQLGDVAFWRIAMRPGRPMAVGRLRPELQAKSGPNARPSSVNSYQDGSIQSADGSSVLFGLPGNPVAVMVTFLAFVRPALLRMMGCTRSAPPLLRAVSTEAMRKKPGRTEYQRGLVTTAADGTLQVRTTGNQGSGVLSSMVQANGLIVLHHGQGNVAPGDMVDVMMFDGVI
ncbi:molybdopterin molybdenumtransferase MoeA [Diaphorobacter nitroreducens]|uniref:molybdopterin molybdotransferase MoeA n=1 Tax=Diaphorobacter nitroreducens TaxID=164759 RepID=UPI000B599660|nr:gephyrin-like molybdotransferase Glp [Diaphorobacter nitroreducens]ASI67707.1 molybdopterin molybdenumtransferase MoeA [Diaphorobacter nitroreducens]